jgi:CzcA family heavy metal efflux pump
MIDTLIRWSLYNRLLVVVLSFGFLLWGIYVVRTIPVDVLPDLTAPTVTILVEGRGMAPTEMESLVTLPIEAAINGAPGIRRVRSATAVGIAVVWCEFEWGEEIYRARQTVNEKLSLVAGSLPPQVERPVLAPISSIMGEILFIALESDRYSPMELRTTADTVLRRRLLAIPGVSQVTPIGGEEKQYQVLVSPAKLAAYNLSLAQVEDALRQSTMNTSAGFRLDGGQEYLIQGIGRAQTEQDIGATVVESRSARPIFVRDIADVRIGPAIKRGEGSHNARSAVILGIQKQPGANTLDLTRQIEATLKEVEKSLPEGMRIENNIFRQADFIETSIHNLLAALRNGILLVVLVVVVFLANLRASIITLLAIPLSLVVAFVALKYSGSTINSMTLGGLAIAIGALVDDAIIDVENVFRRLRQNAHLPERDRRSALQVIYDASREIRASIVFATLIIALVFLPLFFLGSIEGRLLKPLGSAYLVALGASLVVALTLTPALCLYLLPRTKAVLEGHEARIIRWLKERYQTVLPRALDHPHLIFAFASMLLLITLVGLFFMGRSFLPEFNEGALTISAVTLPGTNLQQSDELGRAIERILLAVPEVKSVARRTGRAELDEHAQGVESAELDVGLQMKDRPKEEVLKDMRERLSLLPGVNTTIGQPISHRIDHMLSGTRASIAVKIFGNDLRVLRALAKQTEAAMRGTDGLVDLATEQQIDIPLLRVKFDRDALARYGVQPGAAAAALRTAYSGDEVSQVLEGQVAFPLVVRYTGDSLQDFQRTLIDTPSGARVPLAAVASITEDRGPNFIMREDVQRKISVTANVAGRDLRSVVNEIQRRVQDAVTLPTGYHVQYGGQFESEAAASHLLLLLGLGVIAGILVILAGAFHSWRDAAIVMLNLPLALIGGVAGVFISGGVLSVASVIGFITLFGIATRNGILVVSHIKHLQQQEGIAHFREAVLRGALERLSPILMTALATALALVPLALGSGKPGSELEAPMAIVIFFGLVSSTLLNIVVVPVAYYKFAATRSPVESMDTWQAAKTPGSEQSGPVAASA